MAQKKATHLLLMGPDLATVIVRERIGVRIVSCAGSGTHTAVDSRARGWPASAVASCRFIFTRPLALRGISEGATTVQEGPSSVISRNEVIDQEGWVSRDTFDQSAIVAHSAGVKIRASSTDSTMEETMVMENCR